MKKRIITAIVILAIVIPIIITGGPLFKYFIGIISVLGYRELLILKKSHQEIPVVIKLIGMALVLYLSLANTMIGAVNFPELLLPLILILLPTVFYKNDKYKSSDAFYMLGIIYLLGIVFKLFIIVRENSLYLFLYLISITILTDTFAYAVGMLIGKHKMAPVVSPNKSWEGAIGGLIGGSIIPLIIYHNLISPIDYKIIIITICLSIIGQIGDLFFSKIKRENGIKDFSNLMPGHGGILDRIDSLIFVLIAYILITSII